MLVIFSQLFLYSLKYANNFLIGVQLYDVVLVSTVQ